MHLDATGFGFRGLGRDPVAHCQPLSFHYTCEVRKMKPTLSRERKSISPQYWRILSLNWDFPFLEV